MEATPEGPKNEFETIQAEAHEVTKRDTDLFFNAARVVPEEAMRKMVDGKRAWQRLVLEVPREEDWRGEKRTVYDQVLKPVPGRLYWNAERRAIVFVGPENARSESILREGDLIEDKQMCEALASASREEGLKRLGPTAYIAGAAKTTMASEILLRTKPASAASITGSDFIAAFQSRIREKGKIAVVPGAGSEDAGHAERRSWMERHARLLQWMAGEHGTWNVCDPSDEEWWTVYVDEEDITGYKGDDGDTVPVPSRILQRIADKAKYYAKNSHFIHPANHFGD